LPRLAVLAGGGTRRANPRKPRRGYALPTTIIMGAITGTGGAAYDVGNGDYNRKIDERIDRIRSTCNID
jgi:hypothetical protein